MLLLLKGMDSKVLNHGKEKIKELFSKDNRIKIIVAMLIAAVILIFASEMFAKEEAAVKTDDDTIEIYTKNTEERIEKLLQSISGVGKAKVLVTFDGSNKNIYAVKKSQAADYNETSDGNREERNEIDEEYIIIDNGNREEALMEYYLLPSVSGVVVVCEGGGNTKVREKVISAVTTALNIGSDKVYVAELN